MMAGDKRTMREILTDPRYEQFAADCTAWGRMVVPDRFPWKYMGLTDDAFLGLDLRFMQSGDVASMEQKAKWLLVVRQAERDVMDWWRWWGGWTAAARQLGRYRPAVVSARVPTVAAAPVGGQGVL